MAIDTTKLILRYQVLDLGDVGGTTLSGVEAREIIEDYLADALVEGDNISIVYTDVPTAGIIEISTKADLNISSLTTTSGIVFGTVISGTGDIYCNDLYTAGSTIYVGGDSGLVFSKSGSYGYIALDPSDSVVNSKIFIKVDNDNYFEIGDNNVTCYSSLTTAGDLYFGANTISGTGDIYCNDLYTAGSTVYIGDNAILSESGAALKSNSPIGIGDLLVLSAADSGDLEVNYGIVVDGVDSSLEFTESSANIGISDDPSLITVVSGIVAVNGNLGITGTCSGIEYEPIFWDNIRVPGLQASIIDTRIPDIGQFDNAVDYFGVYTYRFDPDSVEEVHMNIQMPHGYKEGTDVYPHLRWAPTTASGGAVRWGIEYTWTNVDDVFPTPSVLIINDAADGVTNKQQIASFGSIDGTGKEISSMLLIRLFRYATHVDDDYEYDAAFLEFDINYQINTPGSRQQYIK